jgi:hypothetical protein
MNLAYLLATFGWPPAMLGADYRFYEASALAIAEFRRCEFTANAPGPATRLAVTVKTPATSHEVGQDRVVASEWRGAARTSKAMKVRLRELLGL